MRSHISFPRTCTSWYMCSQTDTSPSEGVGTCATNSARVHPTVLLRASSSRQCPSGTRQRPGPPATICTGTGATAGVGTLPHRWLDTLYWPTGSWAQARRSLPERHTSAGSLHTQPTVSTPTHSSAALWVAPVTGCIPRAASSACARTSPPP